MPTPLLSLTHSYSLLPPLPTSLASLPRSAVLTPLSEPYTAVPCATFPLSAALGMMDLWVPWGVGGDFGGRRDTLGVL